MDEGDQKVPKLEAPWFREGLRWEGGTVPNAIWNPSKIVGLTKLGIIQGS